MKSILSPYNDTLFNEYLLKYVKSSLMRRCAVFRKTDEQMKYILNDSDPLDYYTPDDLIKSIKLNGRLIYFSNQDLINHVVYNLGQRFWYSELARIHNMIHKLYLEFKGKLDSEKKSLQPHKLSHKKLAPQRVQGVKK